MKLVLLAIISAGIAASGCFADPAIVETPATSYLGEGSANPNPVISLKSDVEDWYKDAVVYHLWIAAFHDSDGDGIGDLRGIIRKLDSLKDLGIDTIWLSPFFRNASNPRNLHGYDVTDHYEVDPRFGTNEDAESLVRECHARGMRIIFDFVPNHVSNRHPWFVESSDPDSPKRDWFLWRDGRPEKGWTGFNDRSGWHAHEDGGFYYGIFWSGMPDLNHRNPQVRESLADAARFWLDRGFDGIRMDAVKFLFENLEGDGERPDQENRPESVAWFEAWRREVMDPYEEMGYAKFMVAENWTNDRKEMLDWFSHDGRPTFHMTLNFPLLPALTRLDATVARKMWSWDAGLPAHAWLGNFSSNHDMAADRPGTLFAGDPARQRAQAAWLLLGPGTPFIYYGNEIGQPQGGESGDRRHRHPLDWQELDRQRADPASLWHWHRELIALRHAHASLRRGKAEFLPTDAPGKVLAMWRESDGDATLTVFNATSDVIDSPVVTIPVRPAASVPKFVLGEGPPPKGDGVVLRLGTLAPYEAKVLAWEIN